jgi:hypothetical protein
MSTETNRSPGVRATLLSLWWQFLPLSLSDVTMAAADPLLSTALAHLPAARMNLAASGVAKSVAVCLESPIIKILHASNTLAAGRRSARALWRFLLYMLAVLTAGFVILVLPPVFDRLAPWILGVTGPLASSTHTVLLWLILWPAVIGWRRYFQGLLIRKGFGAAVGRASLVRLALFALVVGLGLQSGVSGLHLAGFSLICGVTSEAVLVTIVAYRHREQLAQVPDEVPGLPGDVQEVASFYWPLACAMLLTWGARALLLSILARGADSMLALAAWPTGWGFVLLIANATRMVQQVIIKNRTHLPDALLMRFAASVGVFFSALLFGVSLTGWGQQLLDAFVGHDAQLMKNVWPIVLICSLVPLFVSLQNAMQGFLIEGGDTDRVNAATVAGSSVVLTLAAVGIYRGYSGAITASVAMVIGLAVELVWLARGLAAVSAHVTEL